MQNNIDTCNLDIDVDIEKNYTFKYENEYIKVYKEIGESYKRVVLKVLGYILYQKKYNNLLINHIYQKFKLDVCCYDFENNLLFMAECNNIRWDLINYISKHSNIKELAIIISEYNISEVLDEIKQKISKNKVKNIKVINFLPDFVNDWLDPNDIVILTDWYEVSSI